MNNIFQTQVPNHRLCSDHFTKDQIQRYPVQLEQYGYGLNPGAAPDVPLHIKRENVDMICHPHPEKPALSAKKLAPGP